MQQKLGLELSCHHKHRLGTLSPPPSQQSHKDPWKYGHLTPKLPHPKSWPRLLSHCLSLFICLYVSLLSPCVSFFHQFMCLCFLFFFLSLSLSLSVSRVSSFLFGSLSLFLLVPFCLLVFLHLCVSVLLCCSDFLSLGFLFFFLGVFLLVSFSCLSFSLAFSCIQRIPLSLYKYIYIYGIRPICRLHFG